MVIATGAPDAGAAEGCGSADFEQRGRVVADHLQLRDDLAANLFLLDLLGQEPLQLGHGREGLLGESDLVERVDLVADFLLLLERALEYVEHRRVGCLWRLYGTELHVAVARQQEVQQLHGVHVLFLALQPQPARGADELLVLAPGGHREVGVRRAQFGVDLAVDGFDDTLIHHENPHRSRDAPDSTRDVGPAVNPLILSTRTQISCRAEQASHLRAGDVAQLLHVSE